MRALVAYGSKYGSTKEIAERIGKNLAQSGMTVDLKDIKEDDGARLSDYDMAVVGSGIYAGKWMKPVKKFLENGASDAGKCKVAVFACCMDAADPKLAEDARKRYLADVVAEAKVNPVATGLFAGVVDFNKYGFVVKGIMKSIVSKRVEEQQGKEAAANMPMVTDNRDWAQIDAWTKELLAKLG